MEQKVHELDARLRQMKEERDQVIAENDELQVSIINLINRCVILSEIRFNYNKIICINLYVPSKHFTSNLTIDSWNRQ